MKKIKFSRLTFLGLAFAVMFLTSGCLVNLMYGRSGVFVTNNYKGLVIRVSTNNGIVSQIKTGETAQIITAGLINGDRMLLTAKFYRESNDEYLGYDDIIFRVWYNNGSPFVQTWDPQIALRY